MHAALAIPAALSIAVPPALAFTFLPRRYRVARAIEVARPIHEVRAALARLRDRALWSPWHRKEPGARYDYSGTDGAPGSVMDFDGKVIGRGRVTVLSLGDTRIETRLEFFAPFTMTASDSFTLEATARGTKITWENTAALSSLGNRVFGVVADRVLGPDYEAGLNNLARALEDRSL